MRQARVRIGQIALATLLFCLLAALPGCESSGSKPSSQKPSTESTSQSEQEVRHLEARVYYTTTQITIANDDSRAWTNVRIEVNPGLLSSGYTLKVRRIEAGQRVTYNLRDFTDRAANRFDPYAKAIKRVNILEYSDPWPQQYHLEGCLLYTSPSPRD